MINTQAGHIGGRARQRYPIRITTLLSIPSRKTRVYKATAARDLNKYSVKIYKDCRSNRERRVRVIRTQSRSTRSLRLRETLKRIQVESTGTCKVSKEGTGIYDLEKYSSEE